MNIPARITPARLREIAALLESDGMRDARMIAAGEVAEWALRLDAMPRMEIEWLAVGDGETVAIDKTTNRVLGSISQGTAGTMKYWKWAVWDQMYTSFEAAKKAFQEKV